jgi:hypothetical protein
MTAAELPLAAYTATAEAVALALDVRPEVGLRGTFKTCMAWLTPTALEAGVMRVAKTIELDGETERELRP